MSWGSWKITFSHFRIFAYFAYPRMCVSGYMGCFGGRLVGGLSCAVDEEAECGEFIERDACAFAQRSHGVDFALAAVLRRACFFADGNHLVVGFADSNDGGLIDYDFPVGDNDGVGCAKIDSNLLAQREERHTVKVLGLMVRRVLPSHRQFRLQR